MKKKLILCALISLVSFQPITAISEWQLPLQQAQPQQAIPAVPLQNQAAQPLPIGALQQLLEAAALQQQLELEVLQQAVEQQRLNLRREAIRNFKKISFVIGFWGLGCAAGMYLIDRNKALLNSKINIFIGLLTAGAYGAALPYGLRALADRIF